jgi:hypothetical protein
MSDDEKQSSGLGILLAIGGTAAAIYTAYRTFTKPETNTFELNKIAQSVAGEVSILIPSHKEDCVSLITEANQQINLETFNVLALEDRGHEIDKPPTWSSKAWACQRIAFKATGEYLVFIEPDVKLTQDGIAIAINCLTQNNLDAVLIQPTVLNKTEPMYIANFLMSLPNPFNENEGMEIDGGFLVINRNAYSALAGHTRVATEKYEGGAWFKHLTNSGFKVAVVNGSGISSRLATIEPPELNEELAQRAGSFLVTYLLPVIAIIGGRTAFKQFLGSIGLTANIATVIKSRRIR